MKIVKNTTGSPVTLADIGLTLAASSSYQIPANDYGLWADSTSVLPYVADKTLIVNDGYDDLPPVLGAKHLTEEGLVRDTASAVAATVIDTANSTMTLTASSRLLLIFGGTVAGQIVKFPDARTLIAGCRYEIWNTSSQSIAIQDNAANPLGSMAAGRKSWALLKDASTQAGTWLFENDPIGISVLPITALKNKAGTVAQGSFSGNPRKATVTFSASFPDANYAITITGTDNRNFTWESKTASGFVINANSGTALTGHVNWHAVVYGEST